MIKALKTVGRYIMLMGRTFARPERMRMFFRQYINEMGQLGVNSIGIVLLISFFIGAVITIQIKLNIESPFMPRWTVGYVTREIMLLEFSSSIMCLILAGKVGSNIASELGTMRVTQQIDALEIMGVNSANYLILPKIFAMVTTIPFLVTFSILPVSSEPLPHVGSVASCQRWTWNTVYNTCLWNGSFGVVSSNHCSSLLSSPVYRPSSVIPLKAVP